MTEEEWLIKIVLLVKIQKRLLEIIMLINNDNKMHEEVEIEIISKDAAAIPLEGNRLRKENS